MGRKKQFTFALLLVNTFQGVSWLHISLMFTRPITKIHNSLAYQSSPVSQ